MKKLIYLCLFLSFSYPSNSQVQDTAPWCPDGATWVYERNTPWAAVFNVYEYQGDTLIEGFTAKKIRDREVEVVYIGPEYTEFYRVQRETNFLFLRESNDSIFILHAGEFKFMYNLSAAIGNQFIVNNYVDYEICEASSSAFIDDTLTLTQKDDFVVQNLVLERSYFSGLGRWHVGHLYGKIGPSQSIYPSTNPETCTSNYSFSGLFCYTDNIRGTIYFQDTFPGRNCDYLMSTTLGLEEPNSFKPNLVIYPNPGKDIINIDIDVPFADLEIIDMNSRLVLTKSKTNLKGINISNLSRGSYIVKVNAYSKIYIIKFIKE